jgi:hypothetical protein
LNQFRILKVALYLNGWYTGQVCFHNFLSKDNISPNISGERPQAVQNVFFIFSENIIGLVSLACWISKWNENHIKSRELHN